LILIGLGVGLLFIFTAIPQSDWETITAEHNPLEMTTAIAYIIAAIIGLLVFVKDKSQMHFITFALMVLATGREMDLHKEWTTDSILKSRFYIDPATPIIEKIIGGIVILFLVYAVITLVRRTPRFIMMLWQLSALAWSIALGLGLLTIAKTMDSMARLFPFLADFHAHHRDFLNVIEETLELGGALFFVVMVIILIKRPLPSTH